MRLLFNRNKLYYHLQKYIENSVPVYIYLRLDPCFQVQTSLFLIPLSLLSIPKLLSLQNPRLQPL